LPLGGLAAPAVHERPVLGHAFERVARLVFRRYVRLEVDGRHLVPDGSFLLCSNHASHLDGTALMVASGFAFDAFRLLAAADYFSAGSPAGRLTRALLPIVAIDRSSGHAARLRQTVDECRGLIRGGRVVLIAFPEGTRSITGELLPFKRGAAFLGVELGVPVVPAHIDGAGRALPKGRWVPRPGRIRVRFGQPILPGEWMAEGPKARSVHVARELERRIRDLARQARMSASR